MGLGVEHDRERLVEVGGPVDVDVAVADPGLDHRDRRLLHDAADQAGAAARDQDVDQAAGAHQLLDALAGVAGDQLDDVGVEAGGLQRRRAAPSTIAALLDRALELPRSSTALPDFRQMPAASAVTLGRAS